MRLLLIASLAISVATATLGDVRESLSVLWKQPTDPPVSLTVSPDGRFFGVVTKEGFVRCYDSRGQVFWQHEARGATDVLIAQNGTSVLLFSRLNPTNCVVRFYRKDGELLWEHDAESSIWSAAVSPDGQYAAIGTGKGHIYLYSPYPNRPRWRRIRPGGIVHSITFTPDSQAIVAGTWQKSGICCYTIRGRFLWRCMHYTERQYELQVSGDGRMILGLKSGNQHSLDTEIRLWNMSGKLLWSRTIRGFDPCARISPQSHFIAVSYASYRKRKKEQILERKVAVYDTNGRLLWNKGGLFFSPSLVSLSPTGESVVVSDCKQSFYNMDCKGKILSKVTLGGNIRDHESSNDGRRILAYCGDGCLYVVQVET